MRESFVIHSEYIEDLPEAAKSQYLMYCYNYGIKGETPEQLSGFELTVWTKIKRRIDIDLSAYEDRKQKQKEAKERWRVKNMQNHSESFGIIPQNTNTHSVIDIDNVSDIDNVIDIESDIVSDTVSDASRKFSHSLFELFNENDFPCCRGNEVTFLQKDFKLALETISQNHIHSDDVIQAVRNYIDVVNDPLCYYKRKMPLDSFIKNKNFRDFLPENFRKENFIRFDEQKKEEEKKPSWNAPEPVLMSQLLDDNLTPEEIAQRAFK